MWNQKIVFQVDPYLESCSPSPWAYVNGNYHRPWGLWRWWRQRTWWPAKCYTNASPCAGLAGSHRVLSQGNSISQWEGRGQCLASAPQSQQGTFLSTNEWICRPKVFPFGQFYWDRIPEIFLTKCPATLSGKNHLSLMPIELGHNVFYQVLTA